MASRKVFFDTNILVYSNDNAFPEKQGVSAALLELHLRQRTGTVSLQVLQEYFANAVRKLKLDPVFARQRTELFSRFAVFQPNTNDIFSAIDLHRLYQFSFWDCMILHAATQSGCTTLYSEDMQPGRIISGLEIVNPFL
jgi:predicted nucleic acid-binding protein